MSYQVLARKWRPKTFEQLAGQEHVMKALVNALEQERLHHAYLFTGTRGVGKTTIARIFAKSLNCETGITAKPCGECATCQEIDAGHYVDLIEVDAASRTGVDDTRELLDNTQYAPTRGRYKVYLIDEVHMFSKSSFNALLKTLEEPPPHVKFLLATTEPQKLPITILSRCLQFNLKRLSQDIINQHLEDILQQEQINSEPAAIKRIARAADGSMRDGLSLLDQAIAFSAGELDDAAVCEMLGVIEETFLMGIVEALAQQEGEALMNVVQQMSERSCDFIAALSELVTLLHRIARAQTLPDLIDNKEGDRERILQFANDVTKEDIQLFYQIALLGRRDIEYAPTPQIGFEMLLLRMLAFRPANANAASPAPEKTSPVKKSEAVVEEVAKPATAPAALPVTTSANMKKTDSWHDIAAALTVTALERQVVENCSLQSFQDNTYQVVLDPAHKHLLNKKRESNIQNALSKLFDDTVRLNIMIDNPSEETPAMREQRKQEEQQKRAVISIHEDDVVNALQETFSAVVQEDTIRPNK